MIAKTLNQSEIKQTLNNFLVIVRQKDPSFDNEVKESEYSKTKFSISKTIEGQTQRINIELLDPPSWRYNNDISCKGFIIYADNYGHSRADARTRSKVFVKNLERFNDIIDEEIKNVNDAIQYELNNNIINCHCDIRYNNRGKFYNQSWNKVLQDLELPYYKSHYDKIFSYETDIKEDRPSLYLERKSEALNHYQLNIRIERLQAHDVTSIINIILNHILELEAFSVSSNSSIDYRLDIKQINRQLLKTIIDVIRTQLVFKKDES